LDYDINQKHHAEFVVNYNSYVSTPDGVNAVVPFLPGTGTVLGSDLNAGVRQIKFSGVGAIRSSLTPMLTNEIRYGITSGNSLFREQITPALFDQWNGYAILWSLPASTTAYLTTPYRGSTLSRRNTPVKQFNDNLTWVKGRHLLNMGGSFTQISLFQEGTGSQIIPSIRFNAQTNDPINTGATAAFDNNSMPGATPAQLGEATALYTALTGRVGTITRSVALSEGDNTYGPNSAIDRDRQREFALYVQDSWRVRPDLTLSAGVRWDVQYPFENLSSIYTTTGGSAGAYGVSGVGNLFKPGVFAGTTPSFRQLQAGEGAYRTYWKNFQPSVGFVYSMPDLPGPLSFISGKGGKAVLRGGYAISTIREGMNTFVNILGSNQGRTLSLNVDPANFPTEFGPAGSVQFRDGRYPARSFQASPTFPLPVLPGNSVNEFDDKLRLGYVQSWNVSFQHELGKNTVVDLRYVGNHGTGLWRQVNLNEVNIFENGFLDEFKIAANNLTIARQTTRTR